MTAVSIKISPFVTYARDEADGLKPLPEGYDLDQMTVVRADQVRTGDLVVGSADQPLRRGSGFRWVTYLHAAFVAEVVTFDADCPSCRAWTSGGEGPWVNLYPHCPEKADALIAVIPAAGPVESAPPVCVNACACDGGFHRTTVRTYGPRSICGDCHRRPCAACAEAGTSTH